MGTESRSAAWSITSARTESVRRRGEPGQHDRGELYRHQSRRQRRVAQPRRPASTSPRSALDTVIGGTAAGAANVISGNAGNGVLIDGTGLPGFTPLYLKADGNTNNASNLRGIPVGNGTLVGGVTYGTGVTGQAFQFNDTAGERVVVVRLGTVPGGRRSSRSRPGST